MTRYAFWPSGIDNSGRHCTWLRAFALLAVLLSVPLPVWAQIIPHQYRVTRTANGQPPATFTFLRSEMSCSLQRGPVTGGPGIRVNDPANDAVDCQYLGAGNWSNLPAGVQWSFTIAGGLADGRYGPESAPFGDGLPGAPGGLRVAPGYQGVAVNGTIRERFPFAQMDAARVWLDAGADLYLVATALRAGNFSAEPGDRVSVLVERPAR